MVVIKTEFGRTPDPNINAGRDHWVHGYVNIILGGPITTRTIAGAIGFSGTEKGHARPVILTPTLELGHFTPSEFQASLMLAAGIFPFQPENFGIGDMSLATRDLSENATATNLREVVLGVS